MKRFKSMLTVTALIFLISSLSLFAQEDKTQNKEQVKNKEQIQTSEQVQSQVKNQNQLKTQHGNNFVDENGDGFKDNAPDADGDGIPNGRDEDYTGAKNRNNGKGFVDLNGDGLNDNAFDSDGDGVADYLDQCPATPYEVEVDRYGCPLDDDLDGVPDHLDQCPGTLPGVQVDEEGCELVINLTPEATPNQLVLSSETSFEFNSAKLKESAYPKLDTLLTQMTEFPTSRWKIVGYADNVGPEDGNIKKSQSCAESVLDYFVSKGIQESRFEVIGMGSKDPVGDNSTPEGRTQNRRVEIKRIDK